MTNRTQGPNHLSVIRSCARLALRSSVVAAAWLTSAADASASVQFGLGLSYETSRTQSTAGHYGTSDDKVLIADAKLGWVFDENGFFLGGMYKYENGDFLGSNLRGSAIGPSIGLVRDGFSLIATYHIFADQQFNVAGVEDKISGGRGFQLDLAWTPEIYPGFGLGPQLTYRTVRFEKRKVGSNPEGPTNDEVTTLDPYLLLWFKF